MGSARRRSQGSEPCGSNHRRTAGAFAKLGSARSLARVARLGRAWDTGRCSARAYVGFAFGTRRTGGRVAGVCSNLGIAAAGRPAGPSAKLERASARAWLCAATRSATAGRRAVVGCPCRAGARMGRACSGGSAKRAPCAGSAVMGIAARECAASRSTRGCRSVMGSASSG